jgi:hypothetical protein
MLKAKKENKVYQVDERLKEKYLKEGFDIYNDKGEIVEHSSLKKIKYSEYLEKLAEKEAELKALKEELKALLEEKVDVKEMKALKKENEELKKVLTEPTTKAGD